MLLSTVSEWGVLAGAEILEPTEWKLNCQLTELCLLVLILAASASPSVKEG